MINNLQNISSVIGSLNLDPTAQSQSIGINFPNLSDQKEESNPNNFEVKNPTEGVANIEDLLNAVKELNDKLARQELKVNFSVDKDTGSFVVRVMDSKSGELVRQIPNEETLQFTRNVENGVGVIVDDHY